MSVSPTLCFKIVTPEAIVYKDDVTQVVIPGMEGAMGVLPQHAPMVVLLQSGVVNIYQEGKLSERVFVGGGFSYIDEKNCTIMADEAIPVSHIKELEVRAYIESVHEQMEAAHEEDEREILQQTLTIARAKLDLLEMLRKGGTQL